MTLRNALISFVPEPVPEPVPDLRWNEAMDVFDHEKLDVYVASIEFVALAGDIVEHLPRGRGHLADQLHRAATSIPLNITGESGTGSGTGSGTISERK